METTVWKYIVLAYVATYIISIPWNIVFRKYSHVILDNWFNSIINTIFVEDYGYFLFSVVFLGRCMGDLYYYSLTRETIKILTIYAINTVFGLFINYWFFGRSIFERLDISKGGYCELISRDLSHTQCNNQEGLWHSKFDASGHYYIIISMSLIVWHQLLIEPIFNRDWFNPNNNIIDLEEGMDNTVTQSPMQLDSEFRDFSRQDKFALFNQALQVISLILLGIWYGEFIITSLFFHTAWEKLVGMLCGLVIPIVIHIYDHP